MMNDKEVLLKICDLGKELNQEKNEKVKERLKEQIWVLMRILDDGKKDIDTEINGRIMNIIDMGIAKEDRYFENINICSHE
jgi:hypothetical protein